jgi:hypothetical protein
MTAAPADSLDDLTKLAETHAAAAKDLLDLLAADPVQAIDRMRARPPVTRVTGPVRSLRIH